MTVLLAGTFKTSDFRKSIPDWVKVFAGVRYVVCERSRSPELKYLTFTPEEVRDLQYDHRPPLQDRDYDLDAKDFVPPQNDPNYIFAVPSRRHLERSIGRKADAEKTVTTKGSDAFERKHTRKLKDSQARHDVQMAIKRGDPEAIAKLLGAERKRSRPKSRIPSRPFPKRQRELRRRA